MDTNMLIDHLALAEQHVCDGMLHVRRQRQLVQRLERDGHDITKASALLQQFEELLEMHIQDRDRNRAELARAMKQAPGIDGPKSLGRFDAWSKPVADKTSKRRR